MAKTTKLIAFLSSFLVGPQAWSQGNLPIEVFGNLPPINAIPLSGDGSKAVVLKSIGDTYHVMLLDFTTQKSKLLMAADPENFLFNWCRFANDTRIVCSIRSYIV